MFFHYSQNNSGGKFNGPTLHYIIEADNAREANFLATKVGIYFDPNCYRDCECCGPRWKEKWDDDEGDPEPMFYGVPIDSEEIDYFKFTDDIHGCIVVKKNGERKIYGEANPTKL